MKFIISKNKFLTSLQIICGVIDRKSTLPILKNILIILGEGRITFTGTDMEMEITTSVEHLSELSGKITVPALKLLEICKTLADDTNIEFSLVNKTIVIDKKDVVKSTVMITSAKSKFTLTTLPAIEYPSVEILETNSEVLISQKSFKTLLEDTMFAMAQQDVRYYLNGLLLELGKDSLRAVATDGHRLASKEIKGIKITGIEETQEIIIPRKGVLELVRFLDGEDENIKIEISTNHIRINKKKLKFTSKLIDGKYPNYQKVIPKEVEHQIKIDKNILKQGLIRASILSNEKYKGIKLLLQKDLLKASAHNAEQEEAEEEIEINYKGGDVEIGFNVTYLLSALSAIKTKEVILNILDSKSSCLILPDDGSDCKYIVMPMRL